MVLDPEEGLNPDGTIRTGVRRDRMPAQFEPVVVAAVEACGELSDGRAELHLYGSVATGRARLGVSDVDLVAIGVPEGWARGMSAALSTRFMDVCRGVEIGPGQPADFRGDGDAAYGNRVFLRHYCVPLSGPDALRNAEPFPGDSRAARGFNGDIGRCLDAWQRRLRPEAGGPQDPDGGGQCDQRARQNLDHGPRTAVSRRGVGPNSTRIAPMTWRGCLAGRKAVASRRRQNWMWHSDGTASSPAWSTVSPQRLVCGPIRSHRTRDDQGARCRACLRMTAQRSVTGHRSFYDTAAAGRQGPT